MTSKRKITADELEVLRARIGGMSHEEKVQLAARTSALAELRNQGGSKKQKIQPPQTDDELHQYIIERTGFDIPRVAVCEDHTAPFQFIADAYFERETALFLLGSREQGKCMTAETLIYDPINGNRVPIKEAVEKRLEQTLTMTPDGRIRPAPITYHWHTGRKECLRVTTRSGRSITVTPEHPFMTGDGWKRCDQIETGEALAMPAAIPHPRHPIAIPDHHVDLLAILLAEGSLSQDTVGFSTGDERILEIIRAAAEQIDCDVNHRSRYDYGIAKRSGLYNPVRVMLDSYGVGHELSKWKRIPDCIFNLPERQLRRFLTLFWMCDGWVATYAGMALASEVMLEQIQHLLLRFGVQSRIRYKPTKLGDKVFDAWSLMVYGSCIERFAATVDLWSYKRENLQSLVDKKRCPSAGRPPITDSFMALAKARMPARKKGPEAVATAIRMHDELGWAPGRKPTAGPSLTLRRGGVVNLQARRLRALCRAHLVPEEEFAVLLSEDLWWDPVMKIEPVGEREVYDLTMDPTESFVANDFVVHNTLSVSILHCVNSETRPRCDSITFGAIEAQAKRAYVHVQSFIYSEQEDEDGNVKRMLRPEVDETLRSETRWKNGSKVEIIVGSKSGVNSPHSQKVHADEVDLMEREVWLESRNMSSSRKLPDGTWIKAQDIGTSTRKSTHGLVQEILDESEAAEKAGMEPPWKIYASCVFESAEEVPHCRRAPEAQRRARLEELGRDPCETCNCDKVARGEWSEGIPRTLDTVCKGKFFRSRGWMLNEDVKRKFRQNTQAVWEAQMECRRPMADGLYLEHWSRERFTTVGWQPRPELGQIWLAVDWGGSAESAVLWFQGPLRVPVTIQGANGQQVTVPRLSYVIFDEHLEANIGAGRLGDKVVAKEIGWRRIIPGFRVTARFPDVAGKQQRDDWREHHPPLRTTWHLPNRDFDPMVKCLQDMVDEKHYWVDSRCSRHMDDIESWRQKNGKEVHDDSSHSMAASRYGLSNVEALERRRQHRDSSNNVAPVVVQRAQDSPLLGVSVAGGGSFDGERAWRSQLGESFPV